MKRSLFSAALIMSAAIALAQVPASIASGAFAPRRIVKTNLVGYAFLSVNANYEQKTGLNTSVGLLGGYKLPSTIHVEAIGNLDGENQTYSGDVEPKGIFVNPYFRYYTCLLYTSPSPRD